ncbi:YeiH family protein [Ilumatobacter sp.]|uniref:YeiH family protein n=1 Tax=Ilumatobacter sp. TaxID=1967498 RepID=UPI003B5267D5
MDRSARFEHVAAGGSSAGFSRIAPGVGAVVAIAAVATLLAQVSSSVSPLVVGIVLGAAVANVVSIPASLASGITFCARTVLRIGIVVLGLRLSLGDLASLGADGLLVVAGVVAVTFFGTRWLASRLGIGPDLGLLVATGYSICGASAIAAMDGIIDADEEETAYAITLVTLCGTLSIVVLPLIASAVGLEGADYGTWVGGAVHDVGQVVATASHDGGAALAAATVVKLTRVVLLAPLVALVALRRRSAATTPTAASAQTEDGSTDGGITNGGSTDVGSTDVGSADDGSADDGAGASGSTAARPPLLPLFVVGFLIAILVRSSGVLDDGALDVASDVEKVLLTVALTGLGLGVQVRSMRRLGGRPLLLGLMSWVLVAGAAFVGTAIVT